jgi:pyridoxal 5'-phosphate synthase pdxT subunit
MKIGILGLQGDVPEHRRAFDGLVSPSSLVMVRRPDDLADVDGISIPGGESTTLSRLLHDTGLFRPLQQHLQGGLPVLATCAGLILLARELDAAQGNEREPDTLKILPIAVRRNDYGAQRDSFEAPLRIPLLGDAPFPGVFIRAPRILRVDARAEPIAFRGEEVVGVRDGYRWGLTFHPELSGDNRIHAAWIAAVEKARKTQPR